MSNDLIAAARTAIQSQVVLSPEEAERVARAAVRSVIGKLKQKSAQSFDPFWSLSFLDDIAREVERDA